MRSETLSGRLAGSPILWVLLAGMPRGTKLGGMVGSARRSDHVRAHSTGTIDCCIGRGTRGRTARSAEHPGHRAGREDWGNPFWVHRLIDGLSGDRCVGLSGVPTAFVDAVRQRLLSLTPSAFALVQAAAVWNHRFGVDEAAELLGNMDSGTAMRSLGQAVDVGLLTESRSGFLFQMNWSEKRCTPMLRPQLVARCTVPSAAISWLAGTVPSPRLGTSLLARSTGTSSASRCCAQPRPIPNLTTAADLLARAWDLTPRHHPLWVEIGEESLAMTVRAGRGAVASSIAAELLASDGLDPDTSARLHILRARVTG